MLHSRQRGDILVAWREMADRVGRAGVTGERERLAAAAAEIDLAPRTACARLLHPGGSAEGIEGRRIRPDVGQRVLAHRLEFKTGNRLGSVAGQHLARRRHVQRAPPPTADAWLRKPRVIVGHDRVDDDLAVMPVAQFLDRRGGALNLLGARHQSCPVLQCPAVILHVRDLDPARAERERQHHHVLDVINVGAVHHSVDGERDLNLFGSAMQLLTR